MELQRGIPNHYIMDYLTCYLCSHVMEVSPQQKRIIG